MLASTLKWLARTEVLHSPRCTLVVGPDPRRFPPIPPHAGAVFRQYRLKFAVGCETVINPQSDPLAESFYAYCVNGSRTPQANGKSPSTSSKWTELIDGGLITADDKSLQEELLDLLDAFPQYNLRSRPGVQEAIRDMKRRLERLESNSGARYPVRDLHNEERSLRKSAGAQRSTSLASFPTATARQGLSVLI